MTPEISLCLRRLRPAERQESALRNQAPPRTTRISGPPSASVLEGAMQSRFYPQLLLLPSDHADLKAGVSSAVKLLHGAVARRNCAARPGRAPFGCCFRRGSANPAIVHHSGTELGLAHRVLLEAYEPFGG